jgi:DHA2 family multidrug resistance protein
VLLGAMIATCTGRLISVGLADLRGALHLGVDEASWIGTCLQRSSDVHRPILRIPRRPARRAAGAVGLRGNLHHRLVVLLPFAPTLPVMLSLLVLAGLTSGTFYPLTLSFVLRNLPMKYVLLGIAMYAMDIVFTTNMATSLEAWYMDHFSWRWIFWNSAVLTPS